MGFLTEGSTFEWDESSQRPIDIVREHGVAQFLHTWRRHHLRECDNLKWGEEVEYFVIHERTVGNLELGAASASSSPAAASSSLSDANGSVSVLPNGIERVHGDVRLSLRGHEVLDELEAAEQERMAHRAMPRMLWRPEYGGYMIEGTPGTPYGSSGACEGMSSIACVEPDLRRRRRMVQQRLRADLGERVVTLVNFPLLGALDQNGYCYTEPPTRPGGPTAASLFTSDEMIHPHFRFHTLTRNIRTRRTEKVSICLPLFVDENTIVDQPLPLPLPATRIAQIEHETAMRSAVLQRESDPSALTLDTPKSIYLDSMAFGMGMNCLQVTFQCRNVDEARYFYDQLGILSPILLALGAAAPIYRGYLSDHDCRWKVIAGSVDDRSPFERSVKGANPPTHSTVTQAVCDADGNVTERSNARLYRLQKSRYDSISLFINREGSVYDECFREEYNDLKNIQMDTEIREILMANPIHNLDSRMADHVAHLFVRDPLVIYRDKLFLDDTRFTDHFENIQSTNWNTVRFKPPPAGAGDIGWRVEFRPLDVQLTDFENAAFAFFIVALTRIMLHDDDVRLSFYMPLSLVDENMATAHHRDAVRKSKFHWRKSVRACKARSDVPVADEVTLKSVNEIMNGSEDDPEDVGLLGKIRKYLDDLGDAVSVEAREKSAQYIELLSKRASGEILTGAQWIRNLMTSHPDYKKDSVVSSTMARDLCVAADDLANGLRHEPTLLGSHRVAPLWPESMRTKQSVAHAATPTQTVNERAIRAGLRVHPALSSEGFTDLAYDGDEAEVHFHAELSISSASDDKSMNLRRTVSLDSISSQ